MMAMAMSLCFFVAGGLFVKAEVAATTTDKLVAANGASVLIVDNVADTGIKFDVEISAENFTELSAKASAEVADLFLGVQVGTEKDGKFVALNNAEGVEEVNVSLNGKNLVADNEEAPTKYQYSFSITYNLDRIFGETIDAEKVNEMYSFELAVKPYYAIVKGGGEVVEKAYAEAGDARSMLHVAQAEIATGKALPAGFADKYIAETVTGLTATVYSDGYFEANNGEYEVVSYTVGTSAKAYAADGAIDTALLAGLEAGDAVKLYGYTADRKVIEYTATYAISNTINIAEEVVLATGMSFYGPQYLAADEEGTEYLTEKEYITIPSAIYFKGVEALEGKEAEVTSVLYKGASIYADGEYTVSNDLVGEHITLIAVIGENTYRLTNVLVASAAFENTAESRANLSKFLSGDNHKDGYYVLLENITFDITSNDELFSQGSAGLDYVNAVDPEIDNSGYFYGTFDGRGYALNNIVFFDGREFGIFGSKVVSGATIKNVAIKEVYSKKINGEAVRGGVKYDSLLFHSSLDAELTFTMENVYIYKYTTTSSGNSNIFFYGYKVDGNYVTWNYQFTNVMIVLELDESMSKNLPTIHNYGRTIGAESVIRDTYWITNGTRGDIKSGSADGKINYYEHTATGAPAKMADIWQKMIDAGNDYSAMYASSYWVQGTNGLPAWKSLQG